MPGVKVTLEFTGKEFKQQYIQLLAQQLPLAEADKLTSSQITISINNTAVTDNASVKIIADAIPITLTDTETAAG